MFLRIYFPGGAGAYPVASIVMFLLIAGACTAAIISENKRNFILPLRGLEETIHEMEEIEEYLKIDCPFIYF